jgi:primase-polymerase (primpol)-like protein
MTASPPRWLPVVPDAIPHELTDATSWYPAIIRPKAGKVGVWDKIPGDPSSSKPAAWSNPATRCTFGEAFMAYESGRFQGVGYMMGSEPGIIGIDLDHCIDEDGSIAPWAREIVESFAGAYWERSVSSTGLHGFCRGSLPDGVDGVRSKVEGCSVELYSALRFLVVTGQAVEYVEVLPELQTAVEALHARLTAGRVRATGTAIGTGLTGRLDSVSPEVLAVLEAVMGGRHSARIAEIWGRDDLHVAGASEDDWALASEIAYQAIRLGHSGAALAQLVEETMRAGPYRAKWDQPRGQTTWLAQDVANAIATVQRRTSERRAPSVDAQGQSETFSDAAWLDEWPSDDVENVSETPGQIIARLERELAAERTIRATQQIIVRDEQAKRQALTETVRRISDVMAVPTEQLNPSAKIIAIVAIFEAHSRNGRDVATLPTSALVKRTGLSKNTVNDYMQDLAAREGSPIERRVTREWVERDDGYRGWETVSLVSPRAQSVNESLATIVTMGGPSDKAEAKAKAKRARESERERLNTPFGRCSDGDNEFVSVTGKCPRHGEIVGETVVRREDFEILNPNRRDSAARQAPPVSGRIYGPNRRDSGTQMEWLQEWPDSPDPPVFQYDDVVVVAAIAGGEE